VRSVFMAALVVLNLSFSTSPMLTGQVTAVAGEATDVRTLFVGQDSPARRQASAWRRSRPREASLMDFLAEQPVAYWFDGTDESVYESVQSVVRAAAKHASIPVLVAYNIPERDCGGYSAGGARSEADYIAWINSFANAIGNNRVILILEPDALADTRCLSPNAESLRLNLLSQAITIFKQDNATASVYIDTGNPHWVAAEEMATRLHRVGIQRADGFALNVSNFETTKDNIEYGTKISQLLDRKHFIIDTSRNGLGSNGDWCNPPGRAVGEKPSLSTGHPLVDAFLWVKVPGESDGTCHGGPKAGEWWPKYALGLVERAFGIGDSRRP
jgi:endoglucanase